MNKKIAIIGAGLSGLSAAQKLSKQNKVTIFDKSRGIGGRMTTRRTDNYHFDHGAQFFTANSKSFQDFCNEAAAKQIINKWNPRLANIKNNKIELIQNANIEKSYYVAQPQMNSLCKHIAQTLNVMLNKQIKSINFSDNKWSLITDTGEIFQDFDYLLLAIPAPQALNLVPSNFKDFSIIANSKMYGCFALMLGLKEVLNLNFDAATVHDSVISWIANNSSKPQRIGNNALVIHSSNSWAEENIEQDLEIIKQKMLEKLYQIITLNPDDIIYENIHRWRYANSAMQNVSESLFDSKLNLGVCGDWLISGKVESAFLSGIDLATRINSTIEKSS